jgi:RHS repeat-associated protein
VAGTIERTYDLLDRLTEEVTPEGTVTYAYDDAGRRTSMTVAGQSAVNYSYDNADRLIGLTRGTAAVSIAYDSADRRTSLTLPNGIVVEYGYDDDSRLTSLTYKQGGSAIGDLTYAYNSAGQRTSVGGSYARTALPPALASATYDNANQIAAWGGTSFSYDANGNLTSDGVRGYTWDARNQLASVTGPVSASFGYDGLGRRRSKTIGATTISFLYDGLNPVQELSGGSPTANLLTGLGIDEYFTRTDAAGVRNYLTDVLGSSLALTDGSGTVQTEYTYEAFGNVATNGASTGNTFAFTGRESDGTGLYYYRARYYDPRLQRFTGEDPLRFGGGNFNVHAYAANSPTVFTDNLGLCVPIPPVIVTCVPPAVVILAEAALWVGGTYAAKEFADAITERMTEQYAQHGKGNQKDSEMEQMTPEEIAKKSADPNRPKNWDERLKRHEKAMKERHSRQSKDVPNPGGGKGGGSGRSGGKGGSGKGGGGKGGGSGQGGSGGNSGGLPGMPGAMAGRK